MQTTYLESPAYYISAAMIDILPTLNYPLYSDGLYNGDAT